ncbi:MAG: cytochrome c-type biogenesis protein CcmH [Candidatus Thiodiazotropha lotti]|uniref:Cytochrome c-type biogenesis protein n=1 Tax=Candidatus Thiodiazotropha endoloripes TaxID=1818881 RepID=A0A1E2USG8_9GAMM|nr:cytochrome c-type biogenesis protein [Candidatus Thiodiazotropha endoloripes]MCG7898051.1 cytochrome c-type biogenesis protein CcmH [Candidatus Thiodiazotropha weberae]MCG7999906.1 cytochrome c-type biogenesis protein CcmH [Candidatus Thiodiazotropha lotti]MCG7901599.1 cytochrome c-type biogenesis protein CcmH [Candidatus Thiodiazotropha weberae]MCG7913833.1 cytochrome c-type biogenesis protein CcmH [Candidatus Thiodiazotropha weberae]MCW4191675.1 cytochrome c-type biogenesis protein CcmH [
MRLFLFSFIYLLGLTALQAATLAEYTFEDPAQDEDFREIIEEMRCLVCQNESLAGSNAELAIDLRNEIYDMMKGGQSKGEIIDFMVARYGDFVLYSPPVKPSTYPIWFGPLIFFLIGGVVLFRIIKRKNQSRETELSEAEQQRLEKLLNQSNEQRDTNQ